VFDCAGNGTEEAMRKSTAAEPFGNPDGSRADIEDILGEFVEFDGPHLFGGLGTRAEDSHVRVIVGKCGAGKTVYMRRLHAFQSHRESVYADVPQQHPPSTETIVKACHWFANKILVEKWTQLWGRAILRSLASHVLLHPLLRQHLSVEQEQELATGYRVLLDDVRRPRSVYNQVSGIVNGRNTANDLSRYLDNPLWDDLEDLLAEILHRCPPIYLYLDAVDEMFERAPMYWLPCQEGLFHEVMRLLRDAKLGGRLHLVVCIRDIVMSSVYRSEHAPRYYHEPHIRILSWDGHALRHLLRQKLQQLPAGFLMRNPGKGQPSVGDWLGIDAMSSADGEPEPVEDYLLRHTRLIPRDVIELGNVLCQETARHQRLGARRLPEAVLSSVVSRAAKRFGDSQLAQCGNQVSSDLMPKHAVLRNFSDVYLSTQAYTQGVVSEIRNFIKLVGTDRFTRSDLGEMREMANVHFERTTDLASVLWQNGLLGYIDESGQPRYYSLGDVDEFFFPEDIAEYIFHPCLVHSVGIRSSARRVA
jgi:hypothetical protein